MPNTAKVSNNRERLRMYREPQIAGVKSVGNLMILDLCD
jgi:hypothetical protein